MLPTYSAISRAPRRYCASVGSSKASWKSPILQKNRDARDWVTRMPASSTKSTDAATILRAWLFDERGQRTNQASGVLFVNCRKMLAGGEYAPQAIGLKNVDNEDASTLTAADGPKT